MSDTNPDTTTTRSDTSTPEPLTGLTGAATAVYTELIGLTEPATVAELAHAAGIGHSTAGRAVATLEKRDLAIRTPGGHDGPRRMPDLWRPATLAPTPETTDTAQHDQDEAPQQDQPETTTDGPAEPTDSNMQDRLGPTEENRSDSAITSESERTRPTTEPETSTPHSDSQQDTERHDNDGNGTPCLHSEDNVEATAPTQPTPIKDGRLAPGALRQMVIDHLQAHPDEAFTATRISRVIEKSSGAIANALVKLAGLGIAEQVTDQPRTFQLARPTKPMNTP
ncbi:MarR family transcriptional regulator [Streptomyces noursei]|uniref:MarR family transcriptional regulator n=1 Tax=Streptomyces noursei TaxID=1971 RepID=UPI0035D74716